MLLRHSLRLWLRLRRLIVVRRRVHGNYNWLRSGCGNSRTL